MNVAVHPRPMSQAEFFDWAQRQDARYEFDGLQPVAMTGGTLGHGQIGGNIRDALRNRLRGTNCRAAGPDAGVATVGQTVRYPDALITCSKFRDGDYLVPNPIAVFEVISKTSEAMDRVTKLREYAAVPSILRYIIVESASVCLSIHERAHGEAPWIATGLTAGSMLPIHEAGIEISVAEIYRDTELFAAAGRSDQTPAG